MRDTYEEAVQLEEDKKDKEVEDEAIQDPYIVPLQYDITSYGADFDVEGLVKRLARGDILIPSFQRNYVWTQVEASRFIESLLLGLPVPNVFLARERNSNKLLVIDGQQRLKTLQFFYNGVFNPKLGQKTQRMFTLVGVQRKFEGRTYDTLEEYDKVRLNDSLIHAIVVRQEAPKDDDTSIYYLFDRLNTPGRSLAPQEIRTAIYHGALIDMLQNLNEYPRWRDIYGKKNERLKDQELILRFLALFFNSDDYKRPMNEFLNTFCHKYVEPDGDFLSSCTNIFISTVDIVWQSLGRGAFRPERALNAAVFDSVMVGLARRIKRGPISNIGKVQEAYEALLKDPDYVKSVSESTSNESSVETRLSKASENFNNI